MMYWNGDWNWGGWLAMTATMILIWGLLAWAIVAVVREIRTSRSGHDPESILSERLARGDITVEQFEELRAALRR